MLSRMNNPTKQIEMPMIVNNLAASSYFFVIHKRNINPPETKNAANASKNADIGKNG